MTLTALILGALGASVILLMGHLYGKWRDESDPAEWGDND